MNETPKRIPGRKPTTRAARAKLPACGAKTRSGKPCKRPAGHGTPHPGEGKCRLHGGITQKPTTRYQLANASASLREAIDQQLSDPDPLNLLPDLLLARALLQDGIERHSQATAAIIAWHVSHSSGYQEAVTLWREQLALYLDAVNAGHSEPEMGPPAPPIPEDFENKPRQLPDLAAFITLIDRVTGIVERIQKREGERSISLADVDRVLNELGFKAVLAFKEVIPDDADLQTLSPAELRAELALSFERHALTVRY
ncbi:HGGxSTG domain-containing protein [Deinococcus frigens]|uniref:HGGxSTG domain-containing protein n=1 Tax=Deinococcus frigens TaxID=249403 RepID=UPI000495BB82|nr:HGGxSTG domain-containing protein [Deinococcus frigens]